MRIHLSIFFALFAYAAQAQLNISGRIILEAGKEAAVGATVKVKDAAIGSSADIDGRYSLTVPDRNAVLIFSYTGFVSQEITVGNSSTIDVMLSEDLSQLNEVVVTGYGAQKRSSISGSVSTIDAADIAEKPILRVEQALQGRTAGVQVAQVSGSPGSALSVRIRGVGTINNSDPLYIVDGIPVEGLDFLNPNDIETINVLKDAASSAIYGSGFLSYWHSALL